MSNVRNPGEVEGDLEDEEAAPLERDALDRGSSRGQAVDGRRARAPTGPGDELGQESAEGVDRRPVGELLPRPAARQRLAERIVGSETHPQDGGFGLTLCGEGQVADDLARARPVELQREVAAPHGQARQELEERGHHGMGDDLAGQARDERPQRLLLRLELLQELLHAFRVEHAQLHECFAEAQLALGLRREDLVQLRVRHQPEPHGDLAEPRVARGLHLADARDVFHRQETPLAGELADAAVHPVHEVVRVAELTLVDDPALEQELTEEADFHAIPQELESTDAARNLERGPAL